MGEKPDPGWALYDENKALQRQCMSLDAQVAELEAQVAELQTRPLLELWKRTKAELDELKSRQPPVECKGCAKHVVCSDCESPLIIDEYQNRLCHICLDEYRAQARARGVHDGNE